MPRKFVVGLLLSLFSLATQAQVHVWQGTVDTNWFEAGNWDLGTVPGDDASVVVSGAVGRAPVLTGATARLQSFFLQTNSTLTVQGWDSTLWAREMVISGTVTHASNTLATTNTLGQWVPLHRVWLAGSNITIGTRGCIDASYRGYPTNAGPGRGVGAYDSPGHAGPGRRGRTGNPGGPGGPEYGDPAAPLQSGSGGSLNAKSGSGGGAIRIEAEGVLTIHGTVTSHGQHALGTHGTGGSGGSIWLTCHTLAGSTNGLIGANGGNGNNYGAAAAAGRIAVDYNGEAQAALAEPCPPVRFSGVPGIRGSATDYLPPPMATLHLPDTQLLQGPFTGKRLNMVRVLAPGFTHWSVASLTINDCAFGLPEGCGVTVAGDLVLTNGGALHVFAARTEEILTVPGARIDVGGSLAIASNSWIHPYADPTNGAIVRIAATGDVTVAAGGGINADYKGYTYGQGPGTSASVRGGGAYGGRGGQGYQGAASGGQYGSDDGPIQAGSGGGPQLFLAGQGGGAIWLAAGNRAVINGTLTALGSPGIADHGPAGSGGGIRIECRTLEGAVSGLLRADGGLGSYYGGSGSGGRIVLAYDHEAQEDLPAQPMVRFSSFAFPYTTTATYPNSAEDGSLWLPDTLMLAPTPTSAATLGDGHFWHVRLSVPGFSSWSPASLTVSNCAIRFAEGFQLAVPGDLTLQPGALLRLDAAPTNSGEQYGAHLTVGGNLLMRSNAWLAVQAQPTNGALVRVRVEGDADIEPFGGIEADGRGYYPSPANNVGPGPGKNYTSGGGYGGKGGGTAGGVTNGLAVLPATAGSPGGWRAGDVFYSGSGGGGIHLLVNGELTVNGTLSANGGAGAYYAGPGGSGGGILVAARRVGGTGLLSARGGNCTVTSGSGGGGRIAVWDRITPAMAESILASRQTRFLAPLDAADGFTGTTVVDGGSTDVAGDPGTAGFYRYAVTGTMMMIR